MSNYDDEERPQLSHLKARLAGIELNLSGQERTLSELMYTASETGLIENMSSVDAITIWKIVELSKSFGDNIPEELRM